MAGGITAAEESADVKALGLVDELDDPSPGHLSDHIEPISSTTTVESKPLHGTLEERFVKAKEVESEAGSSADVPMAQDGDEGKENQAV